MASNKDFSLLTKLTLNTVGFDKGIDQAKQKTKDLTKGTEAAASSIKSSFGSLSGLTNGLTSGLSGVQGAVMGGIGAFRAMIPAINGVKVAFISTGIGAIVVALGVAFAALSTYLTGTSEGSNKLKTVFAYLSGAVTAILNRIKLLGSAIWKLLKGDWAGMKEDFAGAFKGGLLDEIKESAETNLAIQQKEIELAKEKRREGYIEADNMAKIADLREKAKDFETYSASERLKFLDEAFKLEQEQGDMKIHIAESELVLLRAKNALKNMLSKDDKDKELELYTAWKTQEAAKSEALRSFYKEKKRLVNEVAKLESEKVSEHMAMLDAEAKMNYELRAKANKEANTGKGLSTPNLEKADKIFAKTDRRDEQIDQKRRKEAEQNATDLDPVVQMAKYNTEAEKLIGINQKVGDSYEYIKEHSNGMTAGVMTMTGAIVDAANKGAKSFKDLAKAGANAARSMISQNLAIAASNAISAVKGIPFPANIILAGLGAAAITTLFNSVIPQFANGGIVSGPTIGLMGEYSGAKSNPEVIAPLSKLQAMLGNNGVGEVVFRIEGETMVGTINNYNRKVNKTR